ncbi:phosphatidylinositol transfer protein alpha isoform-like [Pseudochaenichthys georgianus]|uniref:phosphatidylinositol transfer protein alpha isoform-like n=1 Tax=Pseudochaenichthys georgianus TaxID=52239 RepID=UPI00146C06B0|nr:phosphatidylinositol transfer protein alpha isoform-like [Pseudochaenichthys georgianus]
MLIKEFRIVLPVSVEEYQVGQLYAVAEASKNESGGGEGVEVIVNGPYEKDGEKGQFTHKIYHLTSKVIMPDIIRKLAPKGSLEVHEEAWNAYPYCKTVLTNEYMKEGFVITIETWHKPDMGEQENVHGLEKSKWDNVEIVDIDIADKNSICPKDYNPEHDPAIFKSVKTGRGPLGPEWKMENRVFTHFHRQLFCWIDKWIDLSIDDIRRIEDETKAQLEEMRNNGEVQGLGTDEN